MLFIIEPRPFNLVENNQRAKAALGQRCVKKGIDQRQTVGHFISQHTSNQPIVGQAIFHDMRINCRFLNHRHKIKRGHATHTAVRVARVEISDE